MVNTVERVGNPAQTDDKSVTNGTEIAGLLVKEATLPTTRIPMEENSGASDAEIERLIQLMRDPNRPIAKTGAELLAYWDKVGAFGKHPQKPGELDSPEFARQMRENAWNRSGKASDS